MKAFRITLFLGVFAIFFAPNAGRAATKISVGETREAIVQKMLDNKTSLSFSEVMEKKTSKLAVKLQKKFAKFERLLGKARGSAIDFSDPVQKWLWFAILGWIAGALVYAVGFIFFPFWYLGYLLWVGGSICFVIWILKKTGNM